MNKSFAPCSWSFSFCVVLISQKNLTPPLFQTTTVESPATPTLTTVEAPTNSTPAQTTTVESPATKGRTLQPTVSIQGYEETQKLLKKARNQPSTLLVILSQSIERRGAI